MGMKPLSAFADLSALTIPTAATNKVKASGQFKILSMPPSAYASGLGISAQRSRQKPHIPYRGDNPEVGKKTGIAIRYVERKSGSFEPFDELMRQADMIAPPRRKIGGKKKSLGPPERLHDEDGEVSMEMEDSVFRTVSLFSQNTDTRI